MDKEIELKKCDVGDKCYFCDYEDKFIFKDKALCLCDYCISMMRELEGWL